MPKYLRVIDSTINAQWCVFGNDPCPLCGHPREHHSAGSCITLANPDNNMVVKVVNDWVKPPIAIAGFIKPSIVWNTKLMKYDGERGTKATELSIAAIEKRKGFKYERPAEANRILKMRLMGAEQCCCPIVFDDQRRVYVPEQHVKETSAIAVPTEGV